MIYDLDSGKCLARRPVTALGLFTRMRGMIGRRFDGFDAMVFPRCNAIHSCFMSQTFDAVFLDKSCRVVRCFAAVRPWQLCLRSSRAVQVIELPDGALAAAGVEPGHRLNVNMVAEPEEDRSAVAVAAPTAAALDGCRSLNEKERI